MNETQTELTRALIDASVAFFGTVGVFFCAVLITKIVIHRISRSEDITEE
jgi:hypothetical protein